MRFTDLGVELLDTNQRSPFQGVMKFGTVSICAKNRGCHFLFGSSLKMFDVEGF